MLGRRSWIISGTGLNSSLVMGFKIFKLRGSFIYIFFLSFVFLLFLLVFAAVAWFACLLVFVDS